ncbi:Histone acetyltransferase GCN5 [Lecanosticta acicola]|uniref:histone acetyltransferase n=1 Tax=Lecanosticta acicola TaxID=111012 RepID=A0AAI8W0A4_9PEZI|nr:Histone acetyltransferase GCN5 [Lecanosticta acicola]
MASVKDEKRKAEDGINGHDAKRHKTVSPEPDSAADASFSTINHAAFPEKPAVAEERNGEISFQVVNNDGQPHSHIVLTGLKCIFQKQLPKMPKDYIARLVYDRTHLSIAIVKRPPAGSYAETSNLPGEVVGGITYRPFKGRQFAEIVFCAISSDQQVKGYGAHLMSHLKDYVKATSDVMYFLTYADNYAIGYFKKQGFTKEITLDKPKWMGYIKDYEGGTIMQCSMLPKIRYLESGRMLLKQKAAVHAKIRAESKSYEIHQPPAQWKKADKEGKSRAEIDPLAIPAIKATGWSPEMDALARQPRRNPSHSLLLSLLSQLQNSSSAWPFLQPVNGDEVHDYYDVIKEPMDLSLMENKLEKDKYESVEDFVKDVLLIVRNCKRYNAETTPYAKAANKLEKEMWKKIREVPEWSYLEPDNFETTNRQPE